MSLKELVSKYTLSSGWFDYSAFNKFCREEGVQIKEGPRHNMTDGQLHLFYIIGEEIYELHANMYTNDGFNSLADWLEARLIPKPPKE